MTISLQTGTRVMFTGDSITDCRRLETDNPLGYGYPLRVAGQWGLAHPDRQPIWLNSGISGNKVADLQARWHSDVVDARPNVVSVMVGINDCASRYFADSSPVPESVYRSGFSALLDPLAEAGVKLILIEPFLLPVNDDQRHWRADLDPKIQVVRDLAGQYSAQLIATDGMFAELAAVTGPQYWAPDGVHPTAAGHQAIAEAWLQVVE
ncbi:SGNH/GDSL hydrolase family protein [Microlunatus elymi]|uniref:SGNH/GDSL hydrolase family protein n=1 Tax=Microlunatus elymi TaxID=2596828 RepID=A0A516PVS3_9ACTN|nr:SGNH/GDSL hydrolase family protein [Microlunatus elymi]QDP95273.1 SGNH/GDSL hydrolase family protein [Microlunatus elymi]